MATQAPAKTSTAPKNTETAVATWQPHEITGLLPQGVDEAQVNLLVPTMSIRQVNPYLVPDIEMVKLSMLDSDGDIYHSNDMKEGHYAPTARALSKIAQVAGIDVLDSRRVDNGADPDVVEWSVMIEMALPSGQRIRRTGTKRIDLHQLSQVTDREGKPKSAAWLNKAREHLIANAETKALNRAVRSLLSLQGAMPKVAFSKPYAILRWVPNMSDPDVRRAMLANLLPAANAAYGPAGTDMKQVGGVGGGGEIIDEGEAPDDDDEVVDGEVVEVQTNGTAKVDKGTGEILSEGEPDWFGATEGDAQPSLIDDLRAAYKEADKAPANDEQKSALRGLLGGVSTESLLAVMGKAFGYNAPSEGPALKPITAGQAAAIIIVGEELGADELQRLWALAS